MTHTPVTRRDVPRLVSEWVADDPSLERVHRSLDGTMVFADVSGFTKMSERVSRIGKGGAETINEIITTCFTRLIDDAAAFGGTLLQFGGDAVLLFFRGEGHECRAAAAAFEMRQSLRSLREFTAAVGRVPLSMTIGVESGAFDVFLVGRSHRQLVVGGPLLSSLSALESHAEKGQILVSAATAAALPRRFVGRATDPGFVLSGRVPAAHADEGPPVAGVDPSMFVSVGLRETLEGGEIESEHRTATIAFVEYKGLDGMIAAEGAEAAGRALQELVVGVQSAIDDRGICFQSADLGVDGGKFYLSLGAPRSTGHDDEVMLLALREVIELDVGLRLRAGVNTGSVFTGVIETRDRRTLMTMGDAVNLAARVMGRAGAGDVLATRPVVERSRTLFELDPVEPFLVKGKRRPVAAVRVGRPLGARPAVASTDLPIVGRDDELAVVGEALAAAADGRGQLVVVIADAGAGKTRLLEGVVAAAEARAEHWRCLRVKCRLYQASSPFFAFGELLDEVLRLAEPSIDDPVERLTTVVRGVDVGLLPWLPLLAAIVGLEVTPTVEVTQLTPEAVAVQREAAAVALVAGVLREPTVICFEDLHWMDDASAELLDGLSAAAAGRPWVVVSTRRPTGGPVIGRRPADAVLRLAPLGDAALRQLLRVAAGGRAVPSHVITSIIERSAGNPLYLLELLNGVLEGGDLDSLPGSVEGLLTARIDRLRPDDRSVLRNLSVLGTGFFARFARDVLPPTVRSAPEHLVQRLSDFLSIDDEGWVSFRHQLVRDVAYEGLPYRVRRELHERVARSIMDRVGDDVDDVSPLLSVHWFRSQRHDQAWRFSLLAADRSRAVYANIEAITLYRRALSAAAQFEVDSAGVAATWEALGEVQELAGLLDDARRSMVVARRLRPDDALASARLLLRTAFIDERLGRFVRAVRSVRLAQRELAALPGDDEAVQRLQGELAVWLAAIRVSQGRFREALPWGSEGVRLATAVGDRPTLARAYLALDYAETCLGLPTDLSRTHAALEISTVDGDLSGEATAANVLGGYAYFEGRWDDATAMYRRARDARERTGDPVNAALCTANLAEVLIEQGALAEADELLVDGIEVWRAANDPRGLALGCKLLGLGRARAGRIDEGLASLAESRAALTAIGAVADLAEIDVADADALVLAGRFGDALGPLDRVIAGCRDGSGFDHLLPWAHRLRGVARAALGHPDGLDEVARSVQIARDRSADHEVAIGLMAMSAVGSWYDRAVDAGAAAEAAEIAERLGLRERRQPPRPAEVSTAEV